MIYSVSLTERAKRDLAALFQAIHGEDSETARKWFAKMRTAILGLERSPQRCAATPENAQLRHLLVGRKPHVYRIIYRILEGRHDVQVLHIRHGARTSFATRKSSRL